MGRLNSIDEFGDVDMQSPAWSPVTPAVASRSFCLSPCVQYVSPAPKAKFVRMNSAGLSPGMSPTAASPGAVIRRNAVALGIPLQLQGASGGDFGVPVPVRSGSGHVVAPSPVSRGHAQLVQGPVFFSSTTSDNHGQATLVGAPAGFMMHGGRGPPTAQHIFSGQGCQGINADVIRGIATPMHSKCGRGGA